MYVFIAYYNTPIDVQGERAQPLVCVSGVVKECLHECVLYPVQTCVLQTTAARRGLPVSEGGVESVRVDRV